MADSQPLPKQSKTASRPSATAHPGFRGFIHVDEKVASRATSYKIPRELSKLYLQHLALDDTQREAIKKLYTEGRHFIQKFDVQNEQAQLTASAILAANRLDLDALEALDNKWSCRWSRKDGKGSKETQRLLYQW